MRSGLERAKNHTCFYCDLAEWNTPPPLALMVPDVLGDHAESATNGVTLEIQPLSNGGPHNRSLVHVPSKASNPQQMPALER